jgi:hypothetical protein
MMTLPTDFDLPAMYLVRQHLEPTRITDLPAAMREALEASAALDAIRPGMSVAITAGSRGIVNIPVLLRAAVAAVRDRGGVPVILPTMGSHGGGTPEGQVEVLRSLGVTEESVGAPIISSLETILLGTTPAGIPVYGSTDAAHADGILVIGRVKPHTDFKGPLESGLAKMMVIGLGKHRGAITAHGYARQYGLAHVIPAMARVVLEKSRILGCVAILENGREETAHLVGLPITGLLEAEEELQRQAKELLGRIPYPALDLLIVDEVGKNISGAGMDTNVIGRVSAGPNGTVKQLIDVRRIFARSLTEQSHGNAAGLPLADVVHRRLEEAIDRDITYTNMLTSSSRGRLSFLPPVAPSDRQGIAWCLLTGDHPAAGPGGDSRQATIVRIKNTLELRTFWISEALIGQTEADPTLEVERGPEPLTFDAVGDLKPF